MALAFDPQNFTVYRQPPRSRRIGGGRDGILWYYRERVRRFARRGCPVAGELDRDVGEIERLAAI